MPKKTKKDKVGKLIKNQITDQAIEEYDVGIEFRKPREKQWAIIEDQYSMKIEPALYGRFNIPLPIMSGFVHNIKSKLDDRPVIKYTHDEEADYKKARKATAALDKETSQPLKNWARIDRMVKQLALMQGVGTYAFGASSDNDGKFDHYLEAVDGYDFIQDPAGGAILEDQDFCGRDNIIKRAWDLEDGIKERGYNKENIERLIAIAGKDDTIGKNAEETQQAKQNRYKALNMQYKTAKYVLPSEIPFVMTEFITTYEGTRWYILFHRQTKIWIKCVELTEVFESNLYPYIRWAPYDDPENPWPLAPAEEMIPVTDAIQTLINQAFENRNKINWGQRAYNPDIFPDPSELEYIEDGLVVAKPPANGNIRDGIYEFTTSELAIKTTIDLANYLDSYAGQKTGDTPGSRGVAEKDKKVGVMEMELANVSDRLGLSNKEYTDAWQMLGLHFLNGLREHMDQPMMVKLVGEKGFENDTLTKAELTPQKTGEDGAETMVDFDVVIQSSTADAQAATILSQRKQNSIGRLVKAGVLSLRQACELDLRDSGWSEEDIKALMDVENEGNREILAEAEEENERLGQLENVQPNRGATVGHVQNHIDFANNTKFSKKPAEDARVVKHIYEHAAAETPFAIENKSRSLVKAIGAQSKMALADRDNIPAKKSGEPEPVGPAPDQTE